MSPSDSFSGIVRRAHLSQSLSVADEAQVQEGVAVRKSAGSWMGWSAGKSLPLLG